MVDSIKQKSVGMVHHDLYRIRPCTRHPSHRQSPGVCSLCVNEKLSKLSTSKSPSIHSSRIYSESSSSSLSDVSSCSSSECLSPSEVRAKYSKRGSKSLAKRREKFEEDDTILSKSRSTAAAFLRRVRGGGDEVQRNVGFWSKVLKRTKRKKMER